MRIYALLLSIIFFSLCQAHQKPQFTSTFIDDHTLQIAVTIELSPNDFVYKDYISFSVDHPDITLSSWQVSQEPTSFFDPLFKETKKIFNKTTTFTVQARANQAISNAHLYFNYYQHSNKNIDQTVYPLTFTHTQAVPEKQTVQGQQSSAPVQIPITAPAATASWSGHLSNLLKTNESYSIRVLLALMLGLLLSFTPCIYPMIPITVGILQAQSRKSLAHNFSISCAYSIGIATTFAFLGLLAATTGQLFGSILANPIFVISIVCLLMYLAGAMFGFYEMYIPRFFSAQNHTTKGGPLLSAFLFGAASGTVASPCLSPGLLLLLTIVATMHSKILGFLLLFAFGVGTSVPLLIIGTFSSSLSLLPRAGMWMLEIKKVFGVILVGMCFYFLQAIVPYTLLWGMGSLVIIGIGMYMLYEALHLQRTLGYYIKNGVGMMLIASSVVLAAQTFKMAYLHKQQSEDSLWIHDYTLARTRALQEHKKLLLDISAPYCSICKAIESKIFNNAQVMQQLATVVPVKIDNPAVAHEATQQLLKKLQVIGVPTIILIDPEHETAIKRWGGELYDQTAQTFIDELTRLI